MLTLPCECEVTANEMKETVTIYFVNGIVFNVSVACPICEIVGILRDITKVDTPSMRVLASNCTRIDVAIEPRKINPIGPPLTENDIYEFLASLEDPKKVKQAFNDLQNYTLSSKDLEAAKQRRYKRDLKRRQ